MIGIGFFRLILALTVVITHTHPVWGFTLGNPVIAVRAFFIISGFYMTMILTEKYHDKRSFLINRALKIYPIYWVTLVSTIISCIGAYILRRNWGEMLFIMTKMGDLSLAEKVLVIISQITIFGRELAMWTRPEYLLIPQAWTLVLELCFYLIIPFIFNKKKFIWGLLIMSLIIKYFVEISYPHNPLWLYRFFPSELVYFLLGWFSYQFYLKIKNNKNRYGFVWIILSVGLLSGFNYVNIVVYWREWLFYICLVFLIPLIFQYSQKSKFDRRVGELSYPVYISHILVNNVLNPLLILPFGINRNWQALLVMFGSVGLSLFINYFVQNPVEKIRQGGVR